MCAEPPFGDSADSAAFLGGLEMSCVQGLRLAIQQRILVLQRCVSRAAVWRIQQHLLGVCSAVRPEPPIGDSAIVFSRHHAPVGHHSQ